MTPLYRVRIMHGPHAFLSTRAYTKDEARDVAREVQQPGVLMSLEPATVKQEDVAQRERQRVGPPR